MANFVIGVGGSGARAIEALIHLAAAGLLGTEHINFIFIDLDTSNGNINRTFQLFQTYKKCRDFFNKSGENGDFLKTPIYTAPFTADFDEKANNNSKSSEHIVKIHSNNNESFRQIISYNSFDSEYKVLFDLLYKKEPENNNSKINTFEADMPLNVGFNGSPSVGAPLMEKFLSDYKGNESKSTYSNWNEFVTKMKAIESPSKVMLVGSAFGGTGASSISVIGNWLKENIKNKNISIGASILLPYFQYDEEDEYNVNSKSKNFYLKSKVSLSYYVEEKILDNFDAMYLMGELPSNASNFTLKSRLDEKNEKKLPNGGTTQENLPHYMDLYSALSIADFFKATNYDPDSKIRYIDRENANSLKFSDINVFADKFKTNFSKLAIFTYSYLKTYYPEIVRKYGLFSVYPSWYKSHNLKEKNGHEIIKTLNQYSQLFLYWFGELDNSTYKTSTKTIKSINVDFIRDKKLDGFLEHIRKNKWWQSTNNNIPVEYHFFDILNKNKDTSKSINTSNLVFGYVKQEGDISKNIASMPLGQSIEKFANNLFECC